MKYSDTTNKNGLLQRCEYWTNLGDATITGNTLLKAQFTQGINNQLHKVWTMIMESADDTNPDDPNHANTSFIKTYNLTANTQSVDLDPQTNKILNIYRVEVMMDGTNWYKATRLDNSERSAATTQTNIAGEFSSTDPFYDLIGRYIYLYPFPTANVTDGLKIWFTREMDEFTTSDTTQEPGFDEPFHEMLPMAASLEWLLINKPTSSIIQQIQMSLQDYEARLRRHYSNKNKEIMSPMKGAYVDYE